VSIIRRLDVLMSELMSKEIFDHIKNFFVCAFLLTIGLNELKQKTSLFFEFIPSLASGFGVIFIAIILFLINLNDGIRKIRKSKYHKILTLLLIIIYIFLSVRIVEMAWDFRTI
jgi:hypothetical protein